MSYPPIAFESWFSPLGCATASLEAKFFPLIASFTVVMEPPAEIVTFHHSCVSNVHTHGPPGEFCTVGYTKLHTDILKCEQGSLLKMIQSEWTCLWMFGFHWRTVVLAETDYLQAPCLCTKWECGVGSVTQFGTLQPTAVNGSFNKCKVFVIVYLSVWPSDCIHTHNYPLNSDCQTKRRGMLYNTGWKSSQKSPAVFELQLKWLVNLKKINGQIFW